MPLQNLEQQKKKRKASTKSTTRALADLQEEIATPVQQESSAPPPSFTGSANTVVPTPVSKPSLSSMPSSMTPPTATGMPSLATSTHQTRRPTQSRSGVDPSVHISQTPFANSSIIFPSSVTQSPVVSISQRDGTVSVNTAISPTVSTSPRAVIATVVSRSTTSDGCRALSTDAAQGTPANTALSLLLSKVLGNQSSAQLIDPNHLFWVVLVCGNISRCQGCSGKILRTANGKPLPPPDDIVLQHKEQVLFQNPKTGNFQLSHDMRNVYYHAHLSCVMKKYQAFQAGAHLRIGGDTLLKLSEVHKSYLLKEFGIKFAM